MNIKILITVIISCIVIGITFILVSDASNITPEERRDQIQQEFREDIKDGILGN